MRTNRFTPKGIIRSSGEHSAGDGACDEVINLRYQDGTMRPVGEKVVVASYSPFFKIFVHRLPGLVKYIGILKGDGEEIESGQHVYSLASPSSIPSDLIESFDEDDELDVKTINNLLVISSRNTKRIITYVYGDGGYTLLNDGYYLPNVELGFVKTDQRGGDINAFSTGATDTVNSPDYTSEGVASKYYDSANVESIVGDISAGLNYIRHKRNKNFSEGWVAVCANLTLFDGSETRPTQPVWFYLGGRPKFQFGMSMSNTGNGALHVSMPTSSLDVSIKYMTGQYSKFKDVIKSVNIYSTYPHSGFDIDRTFHSGGYGDILLEKAKEWAVRFKGSQNTQRSYMFCPTGYGVMESVNYATRPYHVSGGEFSYSDEDMRNLEAEMFYCQRRIPYQDNMASAAEVVHLDFSERMLAFDVMPVDSSGYIRKYGKMTAYNSRIHLFDTTNTMMLPTSQPESPSYFGCSWDHSSDHEENVEFAEDSVAEYGVPSMSVTTGIVIMKTRKDGQILTTKRYVDVMYHSTWPRPGLYIAMRSLATIVDIDTISADLYIKDGNTTYRVGIAPTPSKVGNFSHVSFIDGQNSEFLVERFTTKPDSDIVVTSAHLPVSHNGEAVTGNEFSDGYEYAVLDITTMISDDDFDDIDDIEDYTEYSETDTVVASAQNNPIYFSPDNSYRIGGNVRSLVPNSAEISDVETGGFPLAAFTDNGVYAMMQGHGKILYSNVQKIAEDIIEDGCQAFPTTYGIAFLSGNGIYLLVGRRCWRISAALDGPPDYDIRNCQQYRNAHVSVPASRACWRGYNNARVYTEDDSPAAGDSYTDERGNILGTIDVVRGRSIEIEDSLYAYYEEGNIRLYNIGQYLSKDFRDEVADASKVHMTFDRYRAELIVSIDEFDGREVPYSYVYSFTEKQWHKITDRFVFGSDSMVLTPLSTGMFNIKDVTKEVYDASKGTIVHLQTRCLKFGTESYKAVHRCLGRVNLNNTNNIGNHTESSTKTEPDWWLNGMYLYASRDMRHWSMVGLSQVLGYADLLQVDKTSAHFKYFLISLGGKMLQDSEITGFDADVQYRYQDKER